MTQQIHPLTAAHELLAARGRRSWAAVSRFPVGDRCTTSAFPRPTVPGSTSATPISQRPCPVRDQTRARRPIPAWPPQPLMRDQLSCGCVISSGGILVPRRCLGAAARRVARRPRWRGRGATRCAVQQAQPSHDRSPPSRTVLHGHRKRAIRLSRGVYPLNCTPLHTLHSTREVHRDSATRGERSWDRRQWRHWSRR